MKWSYQSVGDVAELHVLEVGVVVCSVMYLCTFRRWRSRASYFNSYYGSCSCSAQEHQK